MGSSECTKAGSRLASRLGYSTTIHSQLSADLTRPLRWQAVSLIARPAIFFYALLMRVQCSAPWLPSKFSCYVYSTIPYGSQPRCLWIVIHIQARFCSFCRFFCHSSQSLGRLCSMWHRKFWAALESLGRKTKIACVPKSHPIVRLRSQITRFSVLARNLGTRRAISEHNETEHSGSQRHSWLDM